MKKFIILLIIAGLSYGGYRFYFHKEDTTDAGPQYNYAKIERKNIINMITATGTLVARELVEVGTQVSGTIEDVFADFNDEVEAGQLVALIDSSVLDAQVKSAEADLLRQKAVLRRAQTEYDRFYPVFEQGFISGNDFLSYDIGKETAEANVLSSEASLEKVKRNREFAEIRAPISGVIIDRNVEKGQTVASSFNTPRLFIIAEDLSLMEILADEHESNPGLRVNGVISGPLRTRLRMTAFPAHDPLAFAPPETAAGVYVELLGPRGRGMHGIVLKTPRHV